MRQVGGIAGLGDAALNEDQYNVLTSDYGHGGADDIEAGDGNNIILAGSGGETAVKAGSGWDVILGDNGKVIRTAAYVPIEILSLSNDSNAGNDLKVDGGSGNDTLIGGNGDDGF